jgi:hypothetical protein
MALPLRTSPAWPSLLWLAAVFVTGTSPVLAFHDSRLNPVANPASVVSFGPVRLTWLTPRLVRIEVAKHQDGQFDDRATFVVVNRHLPAVPFKVHNVSLQNVTVETTHVRVRLDVHALKQGGEISAASLSVDVLTKQGTSAASWSPGTMPTKDGIIDDPMNLNGTFDHGAAFAGGLDCYSNPTDCAEAYPRLIGRGILSRSGWTVVNDTNTTRYLDASDPSNTLGFPWLDSSSTRPHGRRLVEDLYFLAQLSVETGEPAYKTALKDWSLVSGPLAMPPRDSLGVWVSRYFPYSTDTMLDDVIGGYEKHGLPLSVVVLDVDWHESVFPKNASTGNWLDCNGWGGFTPNSTLFPASSGGLPGLIDSVHDKGLKMILSLHQQNGIDHCELRYQEMAAALQFSGVKTNQTIECAMDNQTWVKSLLEIVMERDPVNHTDWWWSDYPGCATGVSGWDSQQPATLFWSDYVFDQRWRSKDLRSVLLTRYGGLGSQRHGVGFSGDTFQAFSTLQYEIEMTPTASNVLFGLWSHDIGGNHNGTNDPGDGNPGNQTGSQCRLHSLLRRISISSVPEFAGFPSRTLHGCKIMWYSAMEFKGVPVWPQGDVKLLPLDS